MKRLGGGILVLALSLGASAQEKNDGDKIGKDKAPTVAKKALMEIQKKKGCAIAESIQVGIDAQQPPPPLTFEGILRKDFAAVKGAGEVYAKGSSYLMNTGGRFDPPDQVDTQEGAQAGSFRNPSLIFKDLETIVASATFGGDETVDGKDCKVVDFLAGEALVKQHLKEIGERVNKSFRRFGGGFGGSIVNFETALDEKKTLATYRVCVGKEDLLVYRLEFVIRPKLKPKTNLPPQIPLDRLNLDQKTDIKFGKWDEEVAFDIPGVIKAKWAVK